MISFLFNSNTDCSVLKLNSEDGFPHSEIVGSKPAHGSPTLIAACHVLHRLCMPRHPPNALTSRLRVRTTNGSPAFTYPCGGTQLLLTRQCGNFLSHMQRPKRRISGRTRHSCPVRSAVAASIATIHNVKDLYEARQRLAHRSTGRAGGNAFPSSWIWVSAIGALAMLGISMSHPPHGRMSKSKWWSLSGSNR